VRKTDTLLLGNGDIHSLYEAAERIRMSGVNGVLIGRATFGNPWLFKNKARLKQLLAEDTIPTLENLPDVIPTREERFSMALEHARMHAKLKGQDHYIEMRKHMGWYLGHFAGAKQVRNELVRINSLLEVEEIIQRALEQFETTQDSLTEENNDEEDNKRVEYSL
jgi:tRNA-dihydrouridine synthase